LIHKVAGGVPTWVASLLKKSGRLVYLNSKLFATPIYHMLSLDFPPWFFNTISKFLREFFWSATTEARRGQGIVTWDTEGLGWIGGKKPELLNHALRMRWRWLVMMVDGQRQALVGSKL
jgi:hypothetical protein